MRSGPFERTHPLFFSDFGAAFPSLIHEWLFAAALASNVGEAYCSILDGLYLSATAVGSADVDFALLYLVLSGAT